MTNGKTKMQALCAEQLTELRGMFERILYVARSSGGPTVGNIQLADRLIDAVVSWSGDFLAHPEPEELPPGYIDPEHKGQGLKLLETFYKACRSEGGTADEIHLRGLKAVLALAQSEPEGVTLDHVNLIGLAFGREPWATWLRKGGCLESAHCELSDLMLAVLTHYARPTIKPVPVAERPWEREGWCDGEGMCWRFDPCDRGWWSYGPILPSDGDPAPFTYLLPHHALPVPGAEVFHG
jgi:GNAT superfamily N-acetyltransferase